MGLAFIVLSYFCLDFITPISADVAGFWRVEDILATVFASIGGGLVFAGVTTPASKKHKRKVRE